MTLGHADEQILRETVRREQAEPRGRTARVPRALNPLPVMGTSQRNLAQYELGTFTLKQNKPDRFEDGTRTRQAYAVCPIAAETDCILQRLGGEESGGYWLATPCSPGQEPAESPPCLDFVGGKYPVPDLSIEGLTDTAADPMFDDWAVKVNARHEMLQLFPATEVVADTPTGTGFLNCNPAVIVQVPNNAQSTSNNTWPPGPLTIEWSTSPVNVALFFSAGFVTDFFGSTSIGARLNENPANPYPRSNRQLVPDSKYDDWTGNASGDPNLVAWLTSNANIKFTLYPTS